ncbi:hypothetical protein HELRODRAFT_79834, partial [Helobdella robusta]|uniref:WH1 domain-containing protein n=1 Tax=Helobdella robusta TaxID=6412 RepID=T1G3U1_HELRO
FRLWAEIFEVREGSDGGETFWGRVSEDVVPINVSLVQDGSDMTTFQLMAYNRLVEKIFDVQLCQPGTRIIQASDCFVHWRDSKQDKEWGLNFTIAQDARKFRDCCTVCSDDDADDDDDDDDDVADDVNDNDDED